MNDDLVQQVGSIWRAVRGTRGAVPVRARRLLRRGPAGVVVALGLAASLPTVGAAASAAPGDPAAGCVEGWVSPAAGTELYHEALDLIAGQMGIDGEFVVDEMRYFQGPDVPWIVEPHFDVVRRWYVKASLVDDPEFRGRWLLEYRDQNRRGISAVAPYDTAGYESPDWRGFTGEGPPRTIVGLPGTWAGIDYDFVTGEGDTGNRGLPAEVEGCITDGAEEPPVTIPPTGGTRAADVAVAAGAFLVAGISLVAASRRTRRRAIRTLIDR
jgi:hypothetical protein